MRSPILLTFLFILLSCSYLPEEEPGQTHLRSDTGDFALYYSGKSMPGKAFLMVPGGLVDPFVYACWIDRLAGADSTIAIILLKYTTNLAIVNTGKVMKIVSDHPEIEHWVLGGHSLGGVVAASVARKNKETFDGLALMAAWSRDASDLSGWGKAVLSMYGSEDQLATEEEIFDNSEFLPSGMIVTSPGELSAASGHTAYYKIPGGNHAGFGCYGAQKGDGQAVIGPFEQQEQMLDMLLAYFDLLW